MNPAKLSKNKLEELCAKAEKNAYEHAFSYLKANKKKIEKKSNERKNIQVEEKANLFIYSMH